MQKLFYGERKDILINVDEKFILFYFNEDYKKDKDTDAFYWFHTDEWENDREHWEKHLVKKNWFTDDMIEFLDDTTSQL
jgi:hypothetical protein